MNIIKPKSGQKKKEKRPFLQIIPDFFSVLLILFHFTYCQEQNPFANRIPAGSEFLQADGFQPFVQYMGLFTDVCYDQLYGLSDVQKASIGLGFPYKRIHYSLDLCAMDVAGSFRSYDFSNRIYFRFPFSFYSLLQISPQVELFSGDRQIYTRSNCSFSLGYKSRFGLNPYCGVQGILEESKAEPFVGTCIYTSEASKIGILIMDPSESAVTLSLTHSILFHPSFQLQWGVKNEPIQFLAGFSFCFFRHNFLYCDYYTHPTLGGSFKAGFSFSFFSPHAGTEQKL